MPSRTTRSSSGGSSAFAAPNGITPRTAPETAAIAGKYTATVTAKPASASVPNRPSAAVLTSALTGTATIER